MRVIELNGQPCRTYLIGEDEGRDVVLIDPVLDNVGNYIARLEAHDFNLVMVIDTHFHADHISGASALRDRTACEYAMYRTGAPPCVNLPVGDGDVLSPGSLQIRVIHTPGHTMNSICLIAGGALFSGDTLFLDDGGAGRDDLPGGSPSHHWESLEKLKTLPGTLMVYPAHEYRNRAPSTLQEQKARNPHMRFSTVDDFVRYCDDLRLGPAEWMKDVLKANYACAQNPGAAWIPVDLPACEIKGTLAKSVNEMEVAPLSASELADLIKGGGAPVLLDVREKAELSSDLGHLEQIIHIPIGSLSGRLQELSVHKEKALVTVCRSGGRAQTAAQILKKAGFTRVRVLMGGMMAWKNAGFPVKK